jgi:alanine racemase
MSTHASLIIDLQALADNYQTLQTQAGSHVQVAGVVKANAYGLGMEQVVAKLEQLNCPHYFVATMDEAVALRGFTNKPIAVLGGANDTDDVALCRTYTLTPVINSIAHLNLIKDDVPVILHIDTGMNRLGLGADETQSLIDQPETLRRFNLQMVMSHFACADDINHPLSAQQSKTFKNFLTQIRATLGRDVPASLSNSSGLFRCSNDMYQMVRPGMALYGLNPTPEQVNPMRPVVSLTAPILQLRDAPRGETVGYSATYQLHRPSRLATLGFGYADGLIRSLSSKGFVFWHDFACPIMGRVSMDLITIDLTDMPAHLPAPQIGDRVEILGPHQDADVLATNAGTIGYEILTQLSHRAKRDYRYGTA